MTPYDRLAQLGLTLPPPPKPVATYVPCVIEGNMLYLSGQGPLEADGRIHTGKVGADVTVEEAYAHARATGLNMLAILHDALGDLGRVRRVVKILGMVNAVADLRRPPESHQRLFRPHGCRVRRGWPACPVGGRSRLAAEQYHGRDRGDRRDRCRGLICRTGTARAPCLRQAGSG